MRHILLAALLLFSTPVAIAQDEPPAPTEEAAAPVEDAAPADAPAEPEAASDDAPAVDAETIEKTVDDVSDQVSLIAEAIESKNWGLLAGLLLSLLVAVANRFGLKDKVGGKAIPWVTTGIAVAGAVGAALLAGVPVMQALSQGVVAGAAAIGGWEMLLKHLLAPKSDPAPAE